MFGSLLARSAQSSRNLKEGGTPVVDGRHHQLTLLRADRTTPVVQPLYWAEEAGLGQAMAEDAVGSELDSGSAKCQLLPLAIVSSCGSLSLPASRTRTCPRR